MTRLWFIVGLCLATVSCSRQEIPKVVQGNTMGTTYVVQYYGHKDEEDVERQVVKVLAEIDRSFSNWNQRSWVSVLNNGSARAEFSVPNDAFPVVSLSLELAERTGGRFDPTLSPLIDLWGFGPEGKRTTLPSREEIEEASRHCGWRKLLFDAEKRLMAKEVGEVQVNFSATAKGYAVDRVAKGLDAMGVSSYLINIGGELRAGDVTPSGDRWRIGVAPPRGASALEKTEFVELVRNAVATSGTNYRKFSAGDTEYSHIIDGLAGRPVEHDWIAVTVTADSCMLADGLATACLILGKEEGEKLVAEYSGVKARFFRAGP
ncbi:MAG: FAD:protein FMN transferase [Verrucomicrobiota bacterium]